MKLRLCCVFALLLESISGFAQGFTSYFTGNPLDAVTTPSGGVCLMGGAGEDDNGMKWFLERVNGGDVLVLRASGSDGYNDYLYSELGIDINSVETIVFNNPNAANLEEIHNRIMQAEGIWLAGGDQWDYVSFWRDTPVASLINDGIANRNIVIGGTSAGMAVLGEYYFSAINGTVTSTTALNIPYSTSVVVDSTSFLHVPYLERVVTDTHYDDPDRKGRHTVFLARALTDYGLVTRGIACEEYTAVCIDETGTAKVFGEYPDHQDVAYFIIPNCELPNPMPEVCAPNNALEWNHDGQALKVYEVNGTTNGVNTFDLNTWGTGQGGTWMHWHVVDGTLYESEGTAPNCPANTSEVAADYLMVYPNPTSALLHLPLTNLAGIEQGGLYVHVTDNVGRELPVTAHLSGNRIEVNCSALPDGLYQIVWNQGASMSRFQVMH